MNQKEGELTMDEYLAHHGIKGQRWGVEHGPPYPVKRSSGGKPKTTNVVKSRLRQALANRAEAKKQKQADHEARVAAVKAARAQKKAEAEVDAHEKLRREVVNNPKKIYKHKDAFSKEEMAEMIKEINYNRSVEDVRLAEIKRGQEKYNQLQNGLATTAKVLNNVKTIYNLTAEINNMLVDSGKSSGKRWTKIGEKPDSSNKSSDTKAKDSSSLLSKADTSKSMSSPEVSSPDPKTTATVDRTIKRYGTNAMSAVDRAMSFTTFNGPLGFYNTNPESYTRFLDR